MEERKIGEYTVLSSFCIGGREIALCENRSAPKEEVYLCGVIERNDLFERLTDCLASESYADVAAVFGDRIAEEAEKMQLEIEKRGKALGKDAELTEKDCIPITQADCLKGKVIVIRGDTLYPEFRRASFQVMYCTGGFGAQPNARGRTCFGNSLYDGGSMQCRRDEVLGILPDAQLRERMRERYNKVKERDEMNEPETGR